MNQSIENEFESLLIAHLQPIRQHVLAVQLYHLFNSKIYDLLLKNNQMAVDVIAEQLDLDHNKLSGFFDYLHNEAIVNFIENTVSLTQQGRAYDKFRPWYIMLIGGYANTFWQIGEKLKKSTGWATRDAAKVGLGSCGISYFDAIPLTKALMAEIPRPCHRLLDLGCGNALYLTEFCKLFPEVQAWGVEPDQHGLAEAAELVKQEGLEHRIQLSCASATEFLRSEVDYQPDLLVLGFILQEVIAQEGDQATQEFLEQVFTRFPDIYVIVIEVDNQTRNPTLMQHGLSQAYYNPYYLLHRFTEQRLEPKAFWDDFFVKCHNVEVVSIKTTLPTVDSTGLELGYLLKRKGA